VIVELLARALELPLESGPRGHLDLEPRDAIVVFGAPLKHDALTPILDERVAAALALWRAGGGRVVVATGGVTRGARRAEADALADALIAGGVPRDAVIVERASLTTADNAALTAAALAPLGARTVWIVTQPFHARRAAYLATRAGLDARVYPMPDSLQYRDRRRALRWLVREYGAWARLLASPRRAPGR
jgi:uncharacterized SAM-binding protein YcdF (DUF218 family)